MLRQGFDITIIILMYRLICSLVEIYYNCAVYKKLFKMIDCARLRVLCGMYRLNRKLTANIVNNNKHNAYTFSENCMICVFYGV